MPYLYVETAARQPPCTNGRLASGAPCPMLSDSLLVHGGAPLRGGAGSSYLASSSLGHGALSSAAAGVPGRLSHGGEVRLVYPDESTDALIYISVVMVFYIAIILMLVLSNVRRCRDPDPELGLSEDPPAPAPQRRLVAKLLNKDKQGTTQKVQQSVLPSTCAACSALAANDACAEADVAV